jgi:uncharacterized protein (DUF736 family)
MARASAKRANEENEESTGPVTESITYLPGDGDPSTVTWCGHTFRANVAKEITGHADGTDREQLNHQLIERARDNPHFKVGDARPKRTGREIPKTAEEYRAYMAAWLQDPSIQHADQLIARFAKDRELQAACEVGSDDFSLLATLFMPKLHEMAKADELTEGQVAQLWINHGINQLPW